MAVLLILRSFGNHHLGREQQPRYRCRVLQRKPGDLGRIQDAMVDQVAELLVLLARAELRDPYWPLHAAHELGVDVPWPAQYLRAKPPLR